jgi:hypothetical protein
MTNKKNTKKDGVPASVVLLKKPKPKKAPPKVKRRRGLTNAELRELMKTNKPPQSWYDEDHEGLY